MMGDYHVRFCERLRVKLPLPTRYQTDEHHKKITFQEEFRIFLKEYDIEYDEQYVWDQFSKFSNNTDCYLKCAINSLRFLYRITYTSALTIVNL